MSNYKCDSVGIIGAGIQGVCIGLQLIKKGIPVTIFDKQDPGSMSSYGNAGHFSPYAVVQLNRPDVIYDIPKTIRSKVLGGKFKGQEQKWFLLRIKNDDHEIRLDYEAFPEFDTFEWVSFWQPIDRIVDFKREAYRKALSELRFLI